MIRVALVAASPALRAGLRAMLSGDAQMKVTDEAARLDDLNLDETEADILIVSASSASFTAPKAGLPETSSVLLLSDSPLAATDALRTHHAWGILPTDTSADELLAAVHALAQGLVVGPRELLLPEETPPASRGPLTERELEVLSLLAKGLPNKQIALALGISEHTIKFHVSSIYSKLNATNRTEAIRAGLRGGWVTL